jgi:hypothetical protein
MMTKTLLALSCAIVVSSPAFAQDTSDLWHHNNAVFGVGPAIPLSYGGTQYFATAPIIDISYGYRFTKLFQADAGFQAAFGAANNQNAEQTTFGPVLGGDHEYFVPLGGRIYIPQPLTRFEFSVGGGAAYLHYAETAPSSGGFYGSGGCFTCTTRGGWGGYGMANASYYLNSGHNFHVGTTFEYIIGRTSGPSVGQSVGGKTTDHWANLFFEFGVSFL